MQSYSSGKTFLILCFVVLFLALDSGPAKAVENSGGLKLTDVIKTALKNNTDVKIQRETVNESEGSLEEKTGEFDAKLTTALYRSSDYLGIVPKDEKKYIDQRDLLEKAGYSVDYSRKSRSGVTNSLTVSSAQEVESLTDNSKIDNKAAVMYSAAIPLAKGRDRKAVTALENAERSALDASKNEYLQTLSTIVVDATTSYWKYVTAGEELVIVKEGLKDALKIKESVQKMVDAKRMSPEELKRVNGYIDEIKSSLISIEKTRIVMRNHLGVMMGMSGDEMENMPDPADRFPAISTEVDLKSLENKQMYIDTAFANRPDLKTAVKEVESKNFKLVRALDDTKKQVDLNINVGYNGYDFGRNKSYLYSSLKDNVSGVSYGASVVYALPLANHEAKGVAKQKRAALEKSKISLDAKKRSIYAGMSNAIAATKNTVLAWKTTEASSQDYERAFEFEMKNTAHGQPHVLHLVETGRRNILSKLEVLENRYEHAVAIIKLRNELGLIQVDYKDDLTLDWRELTTIPGGEELKALPIDKALLDADVKEPVKK